jgi:hypothetical protein
MNARHSPIHDLSDFPLVRFRPEYAQAGYGTAWCAEMDELVARRDRFVLIYPASKRQDSQEDRKVRGLWLKANKEALADLCLGLIIVEPDPVKRAELEALFPGMVRAFGTPQAAVASLPQAEALGRQLLAGETLPITG